MNSPLECLRWVEMAIGFAVILQTTELLTIRKSFSEDGIWRWSMLRKEFFAIKLFDLFLNDRSFQVVLWVRLLAAILLLIKAQWMLSFVLTATTLLVSLRWLGNFNGGSDYMTFLILYSIAIGRFFENNQRILKGALLYIAVQTCLSYFIAGLVKLRRADWRSGRTLTAFLTSSVYETPARIRALASQPERLWVFAILSWVLIGFECSFPFALHHTALCLFFVGSGMAFHLGAFYLFGLNRFFFAWLAAYPALLYWSR